MAKQLITTVGTLLVAVAGFYFGSTSVASATAAAKESLVPTVKISSISPSKGNKGKDVTVIIKGTGFTMPRFIELELAGKSIPAVDIGYYGPKQLRATFTLNNDADAGTWNLVVQTDEHNHAQLDDAFTIE